MVQKKDDADESIPSASSSDRPTCRCEFVRGFGELRRQPTSGLVVVARLPAVNISVLQWQLFLGLLHAKRRDCLLPHLSLFLIHCNVYTRC
jgi:hypothetical protein